MKPVGQLKCHVVSRTKNPPNLHRELVFKALVLSVAMAIVLTLVVANPRSLSGGPQGVGAIVRPTAGGDVERPVFAITTLGNGEGSSLAIGTDGYGLIS